MSPNDLKPIRLVREEIAAEDHVIVVVGSTRTGKSTFIATATGGDFGVSHGLESYTSEMSAILVKRGEDHIVLVDTPGFDNTYLSDYDILKRIFDWLRPPSDGSPNSPKLCGILYLHRISDTRIRGTMLKNLEMFQKLCGKDRLDRVLLTTTMWPDDPYDLQEAVEREKELCDDYWKIMIQQGSHVVRFEGTQESAWSILDRMVKKAKVSIQMQTKLINAWKDIPDTIAGGRPRGAIETVIARQRNTLQSLLEEMGKTTDQETRDILVKEWLSLREEEEKALQDAQRLESRIWLRFIRSLISRARHLVAQFPYENRCRDLISGILTNGERYDKVSHLSGGSAVTIYGYLTLISRNKEPKDERIESLRGDLNRTIRSEMKQPASPGEGPSPPNESHPQVEFAEVYHILLDIIRND